MNDLSQLGQRLAAALDGDDVDAAERVLAECAWFLESRKPLSTDEAATALAWTERSREALEHTLARWQRELEALAVGAAAVRAYVPPEPLAPGYVDRHD